MAKVIVYNFTVFENGETKRALRAATLACIEDARKSGVGAKPLMDTAQEVDESELDDNGFYPRR